MDIYIAVMNIHTCNTVFVFVSVDVFPNWLKMKKASSIDDIQFIKFCSC